jgi:hypothetical protein
MLHRKVDVETVAAQSRGTMKKTAIALKALRFYP